MATMRYLISTLIVAAGLVLAPAGAGAHRLAVSDAEARWIAERIFQNECGRNRRFLVVWNPQEAFMSLGIGHFIWYPGGAAKIYRESFTDFLDYLRRRGIALPPVVMTADGGCPWPNRETFMNDAGSSERSALVAFLESTAAHQATFMLLRLDLAMPRIMASASPNDRPSIFKRYRALARTRQGRYALVDYVNFKGDGTLASERIGGVGWGLLHVLSGMDPVMTAVDARRAYAQSAMKVLRTRAALDPRPVVRRQWLPGWLKRVRSYAD